MRKHRLPDNENNNNVTTNNIDGNSHVKTSASNAESYDSSHLHPLSLSVHIEQNEYEYSTAHNVWSMIKLRANDNGYMNFTKQRVAVDFVVAVDVSGSMNDDNKLSSMLATLEYMVELLDDRDRLAIVKFNDRSSVIHPLSFMTQTNKSAVLSLLSSFPTPSGNTNLSDALFTSLDILLAPSSPSSQTIDQKEKNRISRLFLLTDGQANRGLTYDSIIDQLELIQLPSSLTIHCFGFGSDHHPSCLQRIAFCSNGGLYHYIADHKSIAPTFGQCLAGIFSTVAYNISVDLEAFDGCRFLQFKTKCPIQSKQSMKKYTISVGSMYEHEERSIVIKQSLRAMNSISEHTLFRVSVSYQSCLPSDDGDDDHDPSNNHRLLECIFSVKRNAITSLKMNNWDEWSATACYELMRQLNRIDAAEAIDKSLQFAATQNFGLALQTIQSAILKIKNRRISSADPFSLDILEDLNDCIYFFSHPSLFLSCGIHPIHSYSTMYNQERSSDVIFSSYRQNRSRTYGYTTPIQHSEIQSASEIFSSSISRYTKVQ